MMIGTGRFMSSPFSILGLLCLLSLSLATIGCQTQPTKLSRTLTDDERQIARIESITLLPPIGNFENDAEFSRNVYRQATIEVAKKGYVLEKAENFSDSEKLTPANVNAMKLDELAKLGPQSSRYIMLFYVRDASETKAVVAESATVRLKAVLIDKQEERLLWKNYSENTASSGGIAGVISGGILGAIVEAAITPEKELATQASFQELFASFPEKS